MILGRWTVGLLAVVVPALLGLTTPTESPSPEAGGDTAWAEPTGTAEPTGSAVDPAVTSLAADYGLSVEEATRRLEWQERNDKVEAQLEEQLGRAFGGVWVSPQEQGGRVQVGVVGMGQVPERARAQDLVTAAAQSAGIGPVTDLVVVPRGVDELQDIRDQISARVRATNEDLDTPLPIEPGIVLRESVVEVRVPDEDHITPAQQRLVDDMKASYGDALEAVRYGPEARSTTAACGDGVCDPPLRGGVRINGGEQCTSAFAARSRSDNVLYMFTAGHCTEWADGTLRNGTYETRNTAGTVIGMGEHHNHEFGLADGGGDMAILRVINYNYWNTRAWVWVKDSADTSPDQSYNIASDGRRQENERICFTGSATGTRCGDVTRTGQEVTYDDKNADGEVVRRVTVRGLGEAAACPSPGDSGGPLYANHTAYGIVSGVRTVLFSCRVLYQGIQNAEDDMNVNTSHEGS